MCVCGGCVFSTRKPMLSTFRKQPLADGNSCCQTLLSSQPPWASASTCFPPLTCSFLLRNPLLSSLLLALPFTINWHWQVRRVSVASVSRCRILLPFRCFALRQSCTCTWRLCITTKCWVMLGDHDDHPHAPFPFSFLAKKTQNCHQCQRHLLHAEQDKILVVAFQFPVDFCSFYGSIPKWEKKRERARERKSVCSALPPSLFSFHCLILSPSLSVLLVFSFSTTTNCAHVMSPGQPRRTLSSPSFTATVTSLLLRLFFFLFLLFLCQPI